MAITDINLSGHVRDDAGNAVNGITVYLLETAADLGGTQETTTTTDSNGAWTFTETSLDATYDIKITSGSQNRYIPWSDEITLKTVDASVLKVRGADGAAAPIYLFADRADEAGDGWRIQASNSDTLAIGSDKASAGTIIDYITITNGANAAASTITIAGTLDVNGTVDWDVTDVQVDSSGDIDLVSTNDAAAAIYLRENAGTSGTIKIHADQGTSVTEGAESINILSDAGGVGIRSTANLANAVNLTVDGGTTSSMTLFNDQGTSATEGAASIQLLSDAGGINIKSGLNGANAILLTADAGTSETIVIHADQGSGTGSIELLSDAGGIEIDAGTDIILDAGGADIFLKDDGATFGSLTNTSGDLIIKSGTTTAMTFSGANVTFAGTITIGSAGISEAELEILDGATVTTTELNYNDTGAAVGTVVASRTVTVDSNKDVASFRNITLTGELDAGSLDVSGDADIDGTLETDALTVGGTNVLTGSLITTLGTISAGVWNGTAITGAYINDDIISGQSEITSGLAAADELLYSDAGTVKRVGVDTLTTYLAGVNAGTVTATGLSDSSGVLTLDIQNMTASTSIADADLIVIDDGAGGTLRKMTRENFIESAALGAINIDGGAIDGAVIGANSAAAITGTTIAGSTTIFVNESANGQMTRGLTINQAGSDNHILTFKSSDVVTNLTDFGTSTIPTVESDDWLVIRKLAGSQGGVRMQAVAEGDGGANITFFLDAIGGTPITGDTEGPYTWGVISLWVGEHDQSNALVNMADTANIFAVGEIEPDENDDTDRLTRLILKANGVLHLTNATPVALDAEDDVQLVRAMQLEGSDGTGIIASQYDNPFYSYQKLLELGLASEKGRHGVFLFPLQKRLHAHEGAMWQTYIRVRELEEKLAITERKLSMLGA